MKHDHGEPLTFHRTAPGEINRRSALGLMAASLALANGACTRQPRERIYPWVDMPEARGGGLPVYYASAFVRDGYALGVRVGTDDGRPIKIEGNPLHPSSLGATDVFAQASVLQLWDPDRSAAVMQRLGEASTAGASGHGAISSWAAFENAWRERAPQLQARRGEGLRILTGPVTSPTLRTQLAALLQRFPAARWHQHAPVRDTAAQAGAIAAFGRTVEPILHLDAAACVLALGSDPFSDGPGAVRHAADWARRRAATPPNAAPARLFAVEATPGLFGARADRRIALPPAEIDALLWRVAGAVSGGAAPAAGDGVVARFEAELVRALKANGPASLIVPGACLSSQSHALVHALHQQLGAPGRTLALIAPLAFAPEAGTLPELVDAMNAGSVDTLFILDANPVHESPGILDFAKALAKVRFSVHSGLYRDETARTCAWHLPLSHVYEQWSDALAHDGSATLIQPAIAPLYDSRSLHELVALLAAEDVRDGHAWVQRQWREQGGADFAEFWRSALQRGVIAGSAPQALSMGAAHPPAAALVPAATPGALAAVFAPDPSVHDGRFANNGWLQELPRPFTKLTWDNALLLGPETARRLGLTTGDVVRATLAQQQVDAPVWVLAAHAEGAVTLPLGYGRREAGRVGSGVGFDAFRLQPLDGVTAPVQLRPLGRKHDFAVTQHAMAQHGRALARVLAPGARIPEAGLEPPSLYPRFPSPGHAWGMAIDLDACIGCNACTIACQAENNIPVVGKAEVAHGREMHWIRVDRYEMPEVDGSIFQPVPCMHCEKAPCELVCPVGATMHDAEGLNVQVYNRCIGTRFCSNNCPYKVRRFNFLQYSDRETESLKGQRNPSVTVRERGVMEKCSYCLQRVARARQHAQSTGVPLADGDVVTACQAVCPTGAIHFGDLNDPASAVARVKQSPRHYALLGELDTQPRTTYLARVAASDKPSSR
ncbi:4Fe-4S dicluster domain-containing protein [Variovorax soli]|uniref:Molybdopterin-containing oxidoreductase family iron-sulfur binding subunit n=1 Tax=Variovorax soli TaxID=376815 RepID=A0ABU1NF60_9BURK|nr:4Fe-4S dicluster domain-containing protein [Variovorax soli]MDR6536521.1 molybdopterin-containing oxidoreductase family iron-sulfur binding subunit [Variovorax soli]